MNSSVRVPLQKTKAARWERSRGRRQSATIARLGIARNPDTDIRTVRRSSGSPECLPRPVGDSGDSSVQCCYSDPWSLSFHVSHTLRRDMERLLGEQQFGPVCRHRADEGARTATQAHGAHIDPLTALPSRVLLGDWLHQAMTQTLRRKPLLAGAKTLRGLRDALLAELRILVLAPPR